jgi:hypothetical protein
VQFFTDFVIINHLLQLWLGMNKSFGKTLRPAPSALPNQPMSGLRPQPAARTHNIVGAGQFKEGLERPKSRVQPLKGQVSETSGKSAGQAGLRKDNQRSVIMDCFTNTSYGTEVIRSMQFFR